MWTSRQTCDSVHTFVCVCVFGRTSVSLTKRTAISIHTVDVFTYPTWTLNSQANSGRSIDVLISQCLNGVTTSAHWYHHWRRPSSPKEGSKGSSVVAGSSAMTATHSVLDAQGLDEARPFQRHTLRWVPANRPHRR